MIKENQKYLNRLQVLLDMLTVLFSFVMAHYLRFSVLDGSVSLTSKESIVIALLAIPIYFGLLNFMNLYSAKRIKTLHSECWDIIKVNIVGTLILTTGLFVFKLMDYSRVALVLFLVINTLLMIGGRIVLRLILRKYRREGYNLKHCLIVGATDGADAFIERVKKNLHWGYRIAGVIDNCLDKGSQYDGYEVLGNIDQLEKVLEKRYIDVVVLALDTEDFEELGYIISVCEKAGVKTNIIPFYYRYIPTKPYMDDLDGLPIIDTRHVPLDNWLKNVSKRVFDIAFAMVAILLVSPIMLLSVVMIKLTSPGPVIYKQERVGLNRKNFDMYKFRSMHVQTEDEEKDKWTTKDDPRKTKWGAVMRKTSIDELPQFFNVLKGEMSIVGPRPERPFFVDIFKEEIPKYMIKHQVRPGITGWAQINGLRGDTSIEERIEHDLYYIENWTFYFDLKIVFLTVFKGLVNKNAY